MNGRVCQKFAENPGHPRSAQGFHVTASFESRSLLANAVPLDRIWGLIVTNYCCRMTYDLIFLWSNVSRLSLLSSFRTWRLDSRTLPQSPASSICSLTVYSLRCSKCCASDGVA